MNAHAPILANPDLGALRVLLASLSPRSSQSDGIRAAEAMISAGIEIHDDEGNYFEADDLIDKLDQPSPGLNEAFHVGYANAAEDFHYGTCGENREGEPISEDEAEGAAMFRAVYRGINRAIECYQWRDVGGPPSDYMRRAAE